MNASRALLGVYTPGTTLWYRVGPGWKYLVFLAVTVPVIIVGSVPATLLGLAVAMLLVATTRAPVRLAWGLPTGLLIVLALIAIVHVATGRPDLAIRVVGVMLTALYASRIILLTTPLPRLVDALAAFVRPLRHLGLDPERFGLAVAIFLRSVPHVLASFGDIRDAARARGLSRNPLAILIPVTVQALLYARMTGEALHARGLGDSETT